MNPIHDNKDWHALPQTPLQTTSIAVDSSSKVSSAAPDNDTKIYTDYQNEQSSSSPSINENQSYNRQDQQESDRYGLSGSNMIARSQPATPRPENMSQEQPIYQENVPFSARNVVRGRSNLFANEAGPYFNLTESLDNLYSSDRSTLLSLRIQSKMDRGFFMADNDWTCYRRNYFQVSNVFSIHGFNHYYSMNDPQHQQIYVRTEEGMQMVQRFSLGLSARVANSDKEIELIQHTPKRDKGPQFKPDPKPITPGGNLSMSSVANSQNVVTFERVQFKTATANNGKRRAAQQYYVCHVDLYADTDRQRVKIATCRSCPLVVRGRSPGHYADSQDRPNATERTQEPTNNQHQHVFSSYQKPIAQHHEGMNTPPAGPTHEHNGQGTSAYAYYPPGYAHHYAPPAQHTNNSSNVSSPLSHPPLPSPYPHSVPNYAVHDAGHNDPYTSDYSPNEDTKMIHHQFHMQQTGPIESPHSGYDWQRARYNSSSSGSSSAPSPGQQEGTHYFSHTDARSSYSPSTPTYRKYANNVPDLVNNNA